MTTDTFEGWLANDGTNAADGNLTYGPFPAKVWDDNDDIDIKVQYCGICGTDRTAWLGALGPVKDQIAGHEIVGEVIRVGGGVKHIKVGDIVGVGPTCDTCWECESCKNHDELHCAKAAFTYGGNKYSRGQPDAQTAGGFANYWRGSSKWAFVLPEGLDPAVAAPLMCAGNTVFSPLSKYGAGTKAKKVGILGVGGLGHLAIQFAKAMGAEVTSISRGTAKEADARKLGADHYIATGNDLGEDFKGHERSLDLILSTISVSSLPVNEYFKLLKPHGTFVIQGLVGKPLEIELIPMLMSSLALATSMPCPPDGIVKMLEFAAKHGVRTWIQKYNYKDMNKALVDFAAGKPVYRFVVVNEENGGKM